MHYKFPIIETIDDVLPAIEGRDEFSVTDKGDYTCINYNLMKADTFLPIISGRQTISGLDIENLDAAIRRECRGILFSNSTGKIIRRPLHKFMNVGENEEHLPENIDLSISHRILEKLDGSMASPFLLNDQVFWGSKAGITDVSEKFTKFVENSSINYDEFCYHLIHSGFTPIFEYCASNQKIILSYPEDQLIFLAARNLITGEYLEFKTLTQLAHTWEIPFVESF